MTVGFVPRATSETRVARSLTHTRAVNDRIEGEGVGGEGGSRTLSDLLDSVSCRFHIARVAVDAKDAVAPCTLLHADRAPRTRPPTFSGPPLRSMHDAAAVDLSPRTV